MKDLLASARCPPGDGRKRERDVGKHVVEIAFLGIDHPLDLAELLAAVALLGEALQQRFARIRLAPQGAQLVLILEQRRQLAEQARDELGRRHGPAVDAPERRCHHVLDGALLAVRQL